jgi:type III secretory pathway component EscV
LEKTYRDDLLEEDLKQVRLEETLLMMDRVDAELADRRKEVKKSVPIQRESQ